MAPECRSGQQRRGTRLERDAHGDLVLVGEERELAPIELSVELALWTHPEGEQTEEPDQ